MEWNKIVSGCVNDKGVATLNCIPAVFQNVVEALLLLSGIVAVLLVMYSGIRLISSNADAKQIESAQKTAIWAVAGLVMILFSFLILNILAHVTGANCVGFATAGKPFFSFTKCE